MDYIVPLLSVAVGLGIGFTIRALRQRAGRPVRTIPWKLVVAYVGVTAVLVVATVLANSRGESSLLADLLRSLPFVIYLVYAVYWLVRNRREIIAGWKAESAWNREHGLTGKKR